MIEFGKLRAAEEESRKIWGSRIYNPGTAYIHGYNDALYELVDTCDYFIDLQDCEMTDEWLCSLIMKDDIGKS